MIYPPRWRMRKRSWADQEEVNRKTSEKLSSWMSVAKKDGKYQSTAGKILWKLTWSGVGSNGKTPKTESVGRAWWKRESGRNPLPERTKAAKGEQGEHLHDLPRDELHNWTLFHNLNSCEQRQTTKHISLWSSENNIRPVKLIKIVEFNTGIKFLGSLWTREECLHGRTECLIYILYTSVVSLTVWITLYVVSVQYVCMLQIRNDSDFEYQKSFGFGMTLRLKKTKPIDVQSSMRIKCSLVFLR